MKRKKLFALLCVILTIWLDCFSIPVFAEIDQKSTAIVELNDETRSAGLIDTYSLSITGERRQIHINAVVFGTETMAEIGFKNIEIQHSVTGTSGWVTERTPGNDVITNAIYHRKNNEAQTVGGGYYYRVILDVYAKETGWFFPTSESITVTTNVVYVSS